LFAHHPHVKNVPARQSVIVFLAGDNNLDISKVPDEYAACDPHCDILSRIRLLLAATTEPRPVTFAIFLEHPHSATQLFSFSVDALRKPVLVTNAGMIGNMETLDRAARSDLFALAAKMVANDRFSMERKCLLWSINYPTASRR
jgi:hypothetical protein